MIIMNLDQMSTVEVEVVVAVVDEVEGGVDMTVAVVVAAVTMSWAGEVVMNLEGAVAEVTMILEDEAVEVIMILVDGEGMIQADVEDTMAATTILEEAVTTETEVQEEGITNVVDINLLSFYVAYV